MSSQSLYHTWQRYKTMRSHRISAMPIAILMPHSACNCRCVMCDIWKGNPDLKQLTPADVEQLLQSLKQLGTRLVVMSGGEALLNANFFTLCRILATAGIRVSLLSTGMTLEKQAAAVTAQVQEVIVSLDGSPLLHDEIRNIPGAFAKLKAGVTAIKKLKSSFPVYGRSVIHRLNFRQWPEIIKTAAELGLNQISFLPADVSSHAFNREVLWSPVRQAELLPAEHEMDELRNSIETVIESYAEYFRSGFIAESPDKLLRIADYYAAFYGHTSFPEKKCNAPWVSAVVEADGTVRPCFFHEALGNIHDRPLHEIINSVEAIRFRRGLNVMKNGTCEKCVCYLHLKPGTNPVR